MATSTIPKYTIPSEATSIFTVIGYSSPAITAQAEGAPGAINIDCTRNDLGTPVGVVGFNTNNPHMIPMICTITRPTSDTYAIQLKLRNVSGSAQTTEHVYINVLYVKQGCTVVY